MLEVRVRRRLPGFALDVAFSVSGDILSILGPSGSGKTMTLQCIAGLVQPDEGYIKLNNHVLLDSASGFSLPAKKRKVGFVFQDYALFPHLTVNQNIGYGIRHVHAAETGRRVSELLEKMSIQTLGDRYPRHLSAGQQQRVAVARALAPEPELLLLDEPFSALDSMVKERLQLRLQEVQQFYTGNILFVTHDLTEGYKLGSRLAIFESGRIVQHDYKEEVIARPSNGTVASLVGFRNLIAGSVTKVEEDNAVIVIPAWGSVLKTRNQQTANLTTNQHVTVGIRPEHVQLADQPGENVITGTTDRIMEGISSTNVSFRVGIDLDPRSYLDATLPRSSMHSITRGQQCYLLLPPEHVAIIPG
jgi:molybdate transport system ATP-binding protein